MSEEIKNTLKETLEADQCTNGQKNYYMIEENKYKAIIALAVKQIEHYEQENKQLKQRIDKATEKMESNISMLNESIEVKAKIDRISALAMLGLRNIFGEIKKTLKGESNE